jgi:hypothetical protein
MLPGLSGIIAGLSTEPASIVVAASLADAGGNSPHTFSGLNFGDEYLGRVLVACIILRGSAGSGMNASGVTIGGVSATGEDHGEFGAGGPCIGCGVWGASGVSGTSGNVTVSWTGQAASSSGIILLSVPSLSNGATRFDTFGSAYTGGGSTSTGSLTLNIPTDGTLIAAVAHSNVNDANFDTGVTTRATLDITGGNITVGYDEHLSSQTGRGVSASWTTTAVRGFTGASYSG